jgi:nicotinamidase-related amidase
MLELDPRRSALVTVDLQNGTLGMPLAPHAAPEILARAARLIARAAEARMTIIRIRIAFSPNYADRLSQPVDLPLNLPPGGLPAEWSEPAPALADLPVDLVITKRQWSAFHGTELDLQLRRRGITTVVLGGVMTNFGVEATARDAYHHNYAVIVAEDLCASFSAELHGLAIQHILPRIARVRGSAEIMAALEEGQAMGAA